MCYRSCHIPENTLFLQCSNKTYSQTSHRGRSRRSYYRQPLLTNHSSLDNVQFRRAKRGVYITLKSHIMPQHKQDVKTLPKKSSVLLPTSVYTTKVPYSRLGQWVISISTNMTNIIVYSYIINCVHTSQWRGKTINGLFTPHNFIYDWLNWLGEFVEVYHVVLLLPKNCLVFFGKDNHGSPWLM